MLIAFQSNQDLREMVNFPLVIGLNVFRFIDLYASTQRSPDAFNKFRHWRFLERNEADRGETLKNGIKDIIHRLN